jgi:hypothetical protein
MLFSFKLHLYNLGKIVLNDLKLTLLGIWEFEGMHVHSKGGMNKES